MPHQCVRCSALYDDGSDQILKGCTCGAKLFFYIKKERLEQLKQETSAKLTAEDKQQIELDVSEMIGKDLDAPVVLDIEAIHVLKPGKSQLDLVLLFKGDPLIFRLSEGKYVIDIAETFQRMRKK